MPYASLQTLIDQYGIVAVTLAADRDGDGVVDVGVIDRGLADADGEIDSYIGTKYKLPINPAPPVLTTYAGAIAFYRISDATGALTEEKRKRYDDALRWLRDVAAGKATLDGAVPAEEKQAGGIRMTAAPREFTTATTRSIL